jgi:hypothetical protein
MIRMAVGMGRPIWQALWSKGVPARAKAFTSEAENAIDGHQIEIQGRRTLTECRNMVSGRCTVARPLGRICATRPWPPRYGLAIVSAVHRK